jgi:thiol-disulfide isomerase/thioredoxin
MKKFLTALLSLIVMTVSAQLPGALPLGASIPLAAQKMKSISGKEVSIKDVIKKNGVLVIFSCNTCPYVKKYQSRTLDILKEAEKKVIGVILINSNEELRNTEDSYSAMQQYAKDQGYKGVEYVTDTKSAVADAFNANRTPECFLFNASQKLIYHGAVDDNPDMSAMKRKHLTMAMDEMLTGKEVSVKETRSVGCMIKRL